MPKVNVIQRDGELIVPVDIMAQSIRDIAASLRKLQNSKFTRRAIIVLLQDASKVSQRDIVRVMDGIHELEKLYLK